MHAVIQSGDLAGWSEHDALVVELGGDQPPAGILLAHQHLGRDPDVVVVRRIGVVCPVGKNDRRPRVTGITGIDDQDRNPFVLSSFRIGTARQPHVVGVMATGGPDLLTVDDVFVAVADGRGAQRSKIGAGLGLGVADREVHLSGEDGWQKLLLLGLVAVHHQGRADGLQGHGRQRYVGAGRLVDEQLLLYRAVAEAAVLLGPAHAELSVGAHPLDHRAVGLTVPVDLHLLGLVGRDEGGEVLPELGLQVPLLGCQFYVHCAPLQCLVATGHEVQTMCRPAQHAGQILGRRVVAVHRIGDVHAHAAV